jgi:hypothetical protein
MFATGCGGDPDAAHEAGVVGQTGQRLTFDAFAFAEPLVTFNWCAAVQPVVLASSFSVPAEAAGNACKTDLSCPTGFCEVGHGATSGQCRTRGILTRDSIAYVAGDAVDVTLTIPICTAVTGVLYGTSDLSAAASFDSAPASYSIVSNVVTTFNGQPALATTVRIQSTNLGSGTSVPITIKLSSVSGGLSASFQFTEAQVSAVNAPMRVTISETQLKNDYVASMYRTFGDFDELWEQQPDGSRQRTGYDLSWSEIGFNSSTGRYAGTGIRLEKGAVAFSMDFTGDTPGCDGRAHVDGRLSLVPAEEPAWDSVQLTWLSGPNASSNQGVLCSLVSGGMANIVHQLVFEHGGVQDSIQQQIAQQIEGSFRASEGLIQVCPGCRVLDVKVGSGRIDIYAAPPMPRVRVKVRADDARDDTNLLSNGLLLPPGMYVGVVAGGRFDTCISANGAPATSCERLSVASDGIFNWSGADVPVPNPWETGANGVTAYHEPRQKARSRLKGVVRTTSLLPAPDLTVDSLIGRTSDGLRVSNKGQIKTGCMVPPSLAGRSNRLSLEVNDIPVVGTNPPARGALEATILVPDLDSLSKLLFSSSPPCVTGSKLPNYSLTNKVNKAVVP